MMSRFAAQEDRMRRVTARVLCVALIVFTLTAFASDVSRPKPPATRTDNVTETLHGVAVTDPYRWLEDQDSPETRAWIEAQNAYTQQLLGTFPGREQLKKQVAQLLRIEVMGMPTHRGPRYFYSRRRADQNLSVLYLREKGQDTVLVDPNPLTPDGSLSATFMGFSEDGNLLAYG